MTDSSILSTTTIDGLVRWLNRQRSIEAVAPLVDLLEGQEISRHVLLDLACMDLMHQHRKGRHVHVEDYIRDFPQLNHSGDLLDLIDAELCVASELQKPIDIAAYCKRFPDLASEIEELAQLDFNPGISDLSGGRQEVRVDPVPHRGMHRDFALSTMSDAGSHSDSFSVTPDSQVPDDMTAGEPAVSVSDLREDYPLAIPDWFLIDECLARDRDFCLLRGRDSLRGVSIAMKIIRAPRVLVEQEVMELLDICEAASRVQNPHWVAPQMAAFQMGYLGVIRPWQFVNSWEPAPQAFNPGEASSEEKINRSGQSDSSSFYPLDDAWVLSRYQNLAKVAFAVEAAHRSGATHGAIHARNLGMDHRGKVCVLDAASSHLSLRRWLMDDDCGVLSFDVRKELDIQDVVTLVRDLASWTPGPATKRLVEQVQGSAAEYRDSCLACIGEILIQHVDQYQDSCLSRTEQQSRWRTRLSRWWSQRD